MRGAAWILAGFLGIAGVACGGTSGAGQPEPAETETPQPASAPSTGPAEPAESAEPAPDGRPEMLRVEVLESHPHDPQAYTQGLLWYEGHLWESTGQYGKSELRKVDLETGKVVARAPVGPSYFAEGLARVGETFYQLTWKQGVAFLWSLDDLSAPRSRRSYDGEGWGLCFDGERLVMSDGSATLVFRDPETFAETGRTLVTMWDRPVDGLNELECVEGHVYANVWTSEIIVRIDPETGRVTGRIRADGLLTPEERQGTDVLNGIAYRPETETFLITGKNWPKVFEVRWVGKGF